MEHMLANKLLETFDNFDENDLSMVLKQVARRMMVLRARTEDSTFWFGVLLRVSKWLSQTPVVNTVEQELLIDPPFADNKRMSGRMQAIKHMRERSGMQLTACMHIVDAWVKDNFERVHETVRASWLSCKENVEGRR